MTARDDKKVALPEPACWGETRGYCVGYTAAQLESYAAARVAEATAELRTKLAESEASDAESVAIYRSARARADELRQWFNLVSSEVMRVAPRCKTNDMGEVDDVMRSIALLANKRDELQRRVAELEALVADLFAQYTRLYGVPIDKPPFITHNPVWKALAERAGILAGREGGKA